METEWQEPVRSVGSGSRATHWKLTTAGGRRAGTGLLGPLGGIRCEHFDHVPFRLPQWRVSWDEPKDVKASPEIPDGAEWKHWPVG